MSELVEKVKEILRRNYEWSVLEAPAPAPTEIALQTNTPNEVASILDAWLWSSATIPPYGYPTPGQAGAVECLRRRAFTENCKYWELNTSIALGQQVELPVAHEPEAVTVGEWWDRQERLVDRLGYPLCERAEFERRCAVAQGVPLEWAEHARIYQLAVREGHSPLPTLSSVRGLDAQQWLDNLRCTDRGMPLAWPAQRPPNRVPA